MSLLIQKPTGGKFVMAKTYVGVDDPDAAAYITAVEAADGQELETATRVAIHSFVKGCKNDGIWPAIKASCILAGARTLTGALVPLVGTAPTNNNFVSGDYNRKTGLVGNGSTKYLNSNRKSDADPRDNNHIYGRVTVASSSQSYIIGANNGGGNHTLAGAGYWSRSAGGIPGTSPGIGGHGITRANSSQVIRIDSSNIGTLQSLNSVEITASYNTFVFAFNNNSVANNLTNARVAFYSIGESLDLALLNARVSALITAFGTAIP